MQYICAHCSRSGSPILRKKNLNKQIPIISPRINNNVNIRYKEFIQEKRENSLNRSFEKSLSRSSSVEPKEGINQSKKIQTVIYCRMYKSYDIFKSTNIYPIFLR